MQYRINRRATMNIFYFIGVVVLIGAIFGLIQFN
jgi:hypothetical protein